MQYPARLFLIAALALFHPGAWSSTTDTAAAAASHDEESRAYFSDLPLLTQDGEQVNFYTDVLKDKVVLINFIFTNCDGACPIMTQVLTNVMDLLGDEMGKKIYFVSISIDPERDDPPALKEFASKQDADHPGWLWLTGEKQNVEHIVKKLGQYTGDVETHSTLFLAGNVRTKHWTKITPRMRPLGIAEKLRTLAEES